MNRRREPNAIYFGSGTRQSSWCFNSKDGNSGESHYLSIPQWLPK
ncbi:hypothetical protein RMSM_01230 [Rhodopirellula maiorica SM1]|uniref:Uncharacterized protein n=1 Tax=Rhodopirellula maiorica SM1 TaxID=1265738 RepID=M5RRE0_9BACT|nr:hypothetical protein RMSM_01230 [Rhodopirellula maiorica SM1]